MCRRGSAILLTAAWLVPILHVRGAFAEPPKDAPVAPATASAETRRLDGFELLASAGYGDATSPIRNLELEPYGASFGLDLGYTFPIGFRVGGVVGYGLGRSVEQRHDPAVGNEFD